MINLPDFRKILGQWVKYIDHFGDQLVIFNRGTPYGALVSYRDYERLTKM